MWRKHAIVRQHLNCVRNPDASQRKVWEKCVRENPRDFPAAKSNLNGCDLEAHAPKDATLASNSISHKSSEILEKIKHETTKIQLSLGFLRKRQMETVMTPYVAGRESSGFIFKLWAAVKRETLTILNEEVSQPQGIDKLFRMMFQTTMSTCIDKGKLGAELGATKVSPAPGFVLEMSGDGKNLEVLAKIQAYQDGMDVDESS
ncbi:hypothetical protein DHEL01_v211783, partial [Diaporthe helianthi]